CLQKCERCGRAGATIPCRAAAGCSRLYHFPCAAASGCFQSMKTLRLLCPEHVAEAVDTEDARCSVCNGPGDLQDLVLCTSCGQHFHGACLDISLTPRKRSGWQCSECKVCQTCRQPGQDSAMLVCEACDKGYHTFCMEPAIQGLPTGSWKCKVCPGLAQGTGCLPPTAPPDISASPQNCWVCSDCGRHLAGLDSSGQWSPGSAVCGDCQQRRATADAPMAPEHTPRPDPPAQMSESPVPSEPTDAPVPPPELEPVGGDEETQPLLDPNKTPPDPKEAPPDPKEAPLGNAESPPGELASVEVPPSEEPPEELPSEELPLDQPPPDTQPSDLQPPDVQPPEEPLPLMLPPEEPPSEELPLETPSLAELPPDRPPPEELP
ncbi:KMT2D methyltransferase, partial [Cnemophilus loriae]|nr:KMT2D methyltransferase [Cnemophilus loriae]